MDAQFLAAQRVEAVLGEFPVGVDGTAQDQADLLGDQASQPGGPLILGHFVQLGEELAGPGPFSLRTEHLRERAVLGESGEPRGPDHRGVAGVGAVVAQQRFEGVGTLIGCDRSAGIFGERRRTAHLGPWTPGD